MLKVKGGTRPPRLGLGAAVWVQIAVGNVYTFPLYSPSFKDQLIIGVANDIGENVELLPGIVNFDVDLKKL